MNTWKSVIVIIMSSKTPSCHAFLPHNGAGKGRQLPGFCNVHYCALLVVSFSVRAVKSFSLVLVVAPREKKNWGMPRLLQNKNKNIFS